MESLKSLEERLKEIRVYLDLVCEGRLPLNHDIMNNLQARGGRLRERLLARVARLIRLGSCALLRPASASPCCPGSAGS